MGFLIFSADSDIQLEHLWTKQKDEEYLLNIEAQCLGGWNIIQIVRMHLIPVTIKSQRVVLSHS